MDKDDEIDRQVDEIIALLEDNGIPAAAEYFPEGAEMPYAVVLTPSSLTECADLGAFAEICSENAMFRIELFTLSRSDPVRKEFKRLILNNMPADKFETEQRSFGANCGYMTAIEFEMSV